MKSGIRKQLILVFAVLMAVATALCVLFFTAERSPFKGVETAENGTTASTHSASTKTCYIGVYCNSSTWSVTIDGNTYTETGNGRYVSVNCTGLLKVINPGTFKLYSPVYGFYTPQTLTMFGGGDGKGYAAHWRIASGPDVLCRYDYLTVEGLQVQTWENTLETPAWSDTVTISGSYYLDKTCDSAEATEPSAPGWVYFTETTDTFFEHFIKRCWSWTYKTDDNSNIMGRVAAVAEYADGSSHGEVIEAATYYYLRGQTLPALYFLTADGRDNNVVTNTSMRYAGLSCACTGTVVNDGSVRYYYANSVSGDFSDGQFLAWLGTKDCPVVFSNLFSYGHDIFYYRDSGVWKYHEGWIDDPTVSYASTGTNCKVGINGGTAQAVSAIEVANASIANFIIPTADMFDHVKISDYKGYAPTPIIPTGYSVSGSVYSFVFAPGSEGYSIVSVEGAGMLIIWVKIAANGAVTDILSQINSGTGDFTDENQFEDFTVIIRKGLKRNRATYGTTFTFVGDSSNNFTLTTNADTTFIINNERSNYRCYEFGRQSVIWADELEYDDDLNCYVVRTSYTYNIYTSDLYSLFHVTSYFRAEDTNTPIDRTHVTACSMDHKTRFNKADEIHKYVHPTPRSNLGIATYYYTSALVPEWKDGDYAMLCLGAVGAESVIIKIYTYTPTIEDLTAVSGGEIVDGELKVTNSTATFTFKSKQPFTPFSYSDTLSNVVISYTWNSTDYYVNTLIIGKASTLTRYTLVIKELNGYDKNGTIYGINYSYVVRCTHSFAYRLNLSDTMNVVFGTETISDPYSIKEGSAKVTWKGNTTSVAADSTSVSGMTIWTCKNISPHNGADAITFAVTLVYEDEDVMFEEEFSFTKSIVGYCYEILNETDYAGEKELLTLAVDTLHYCSKAYEYIYGGTCTWDSSDNLSATANLSGKTLSNYTNAYPVSDGSLDKYDKGTGIRAGDLGDAEKGTSYTAQYIRMAFDSAQMVVDGDPYINIVVAANENFGQSYVTKTCTIDDVDYAITFKKGGVYQEGIAGIKQTVYYYTATIMVNPTKFDAEIKVTCTYSGTAPLKAGSASSMTLIYSVNSYAYRTVHKADASDGLKNAAKALYSYGKSAYDYMVYISEFSDFVG